jgi:hypothetical protein
MRRVIIILLAALFVDLSRANANETYDAWVLEPLEHNLISLVFRQMVPVNDDKVNTAELAFVCERNAKTVKFDVTLIPFDGTYNNQQDEVGILIEQGTDQKLNLFQKWHNGYKYIFLTRKVRDEDKIDRLVEYLKETEGKGIGQVTVLFPGAFDGNPKILNRVVVDLSGFSNGINALHQACLSN